MLGLGILRANSGLLTEGARGTVNESREGFGMDKFHTKVRESAV